MKALLVLILSCASLFGADVGGSTKQPGESLIPINAGEDKRGIVSYGLFFAQSASRSASNAPAGSSLLLVLRNTGAKSINMEGVTVDDFSLEDAHGRNLKLYLWSQPRSMGYGDPTVVHLEVADAAKAPQPWVLRFRTKPGDHVPFEINIPDIEAGYGSPQPDVAVVAQTLQSYQVGKTTFADFKRD